MHRHGVKIMCRYVKPVFELQSPTRLRAAILDAELQNNSFLGPNLTVGKGTKSQAQNFHVLVESRYGYVGFKLQPLSHLIIAATNFSSLLRTILYPPHLLSTFKV